MTLTCEDFVQHNIIVNKEFCKSTNGWCLQKRCSSRRQIHIHVSVNPQEDTEKRKQGIWYEILFLRTVISTRVSRYVHTPLIKNICHTNFYVNTGSFIFRFL